MSGVTLEATVESVINQRAKWGLPVQPPCPDQEIERLRHEVPARLSAPVPERYLDLLRITNGIEENGVEVYASQQSRNAASDVLGREYLIGGLIEENEGMRLDRPNYVDLIFFAYSALYVHALHIPTGKYVFFPQIGSKPSEVYDTFDQMMISTLWLALKEEFRPHP